MSERVHPRDCDSSPASGEHPPRSTRMHRHTLSQDSGSQSTHSTSTTPSSAGTYVILQIPKNQVYRVPPPENAYKLKIYKSRRRRRRTFRQCCCAAFCLLLVLLCLLAASAGVFYLMYRPKAPSFSVDGVSIRGVDVSASAASATISPDFNVTVRTANPNGVVGFYYEPGSAVAVYHDDLRLCGGALPAFYQAPRNVTVLSTVLLGGQIVVSGDVKQKLAEQQKNGSVPLRMSVGFPVKVRVGVVTTWKVTVKAVCDVAVSALTAQAEVVSKECSVDFRPW